MKQNKCLDGDLKPEKENHGSPDHRHIKSGANHLKETESSFILRINPLSCN